MPTPTPACLPPLHLNDQLGKVPLDAIKLMAAKDQNARLEFFRRRLGFLCERRLKLRRERDIISAQLEDLGQPIHRSYRHEVTQKLEAIDKELNQ